MHSFLSCLNKQCIGLCLGLDLEQGLALELASVAELGAVVKALVPNTASDIQKHTSQNCPLGTDQCMHPEILPDTHQIQFFGETDPGT